MGAHPGWCATLPLRQFCSQHEDEHIRMGPAVRLLLHANHLQASSIEATGPKGTLLKGDVLQYLEKHGKGEAPTLRSWSFNRRRSPSPRKKNPLHHPRDDDCVTPRSHPLTHISNARKCHTSTPPSNANWIT